MFTERSEAALSFPDSSGIPIDISRLIPAVTSYEFASVDAVWKLSLTRDFIALTTAKYGRWEEFRSRLESALEALVAEYCPSFFVRIGLRYRNVITRSYLGLTGEAWSNLLKASATGELATDLSSTVEHFGREVVLRLGNWNAHVRVQQGLVHTEGSDEDSFLIDCDFFTDQKTEVQDGLTVLDYLNEQSRNLFRFYIEDRLHEAMDPRNL